MGGGQEHTKSTRKKKKKKRESENSRREFYSGAKKQASAETLVRLWYFACSGMSEHFPATDRRKMPLPQKEELR
jgi:hypothetical protein